MQNYGFEFHDEIYLNDTDDTFFDTDSRSYRCQLHIHDGICSILTDDNQFMEFEYTDISVYYGKDDNDLFISVERNPFFYNFMKKKQEVLMTGV